MKHFMHLRGVLTAGIAVSTAVFAADRTAAREQGAATNALLWGLKTVGMWLTLLVSTVVATKLVPLNVPLPKPDGPLSIQQALLAVNGLTAISLSLLAANARVRWARLAGLLFVALFGIQTAVMQIEIFYFNESIKMPAEVVLGVGAQQTIVALIACAMGALLFHPADEAPHPVPADVFARVALLSVSYVALYYAAGFFIAWQSPVVRAYYGNAAHIAMLPTIAVQLVRGAMFALISLFVVTGLKGSLARRAAVMAVLFVVLTAGQLLYPNPMVPWAVRQVHLIEVGTSEFVYGVVATFLLLGGAARRPLSGGSAWRLIAGRA